MVYRGGLLLETPKKVWIPEVSSFSGYPVTVRCCWPVGGMIYPRKYNRPCSVFAPVLLSKQTNATLSRNSSMLSIWGTENQQREFGTFYGEIRSLESVVLVLYEPKYTCSIVRGILTNGAKDRRLKKNTKNNTHSGEPKKNQEHENAMEEQASNKTQQKH